MSQFTTEEINLIRLYAPFDPCSRKGTIRELYYMMDYLMFDEEELETLAKETIAKLENMTDDEFETAAAEWGLF
jgi:hypothetical protein